MAAKNWCFTLNNYTEEDYVRLLAYPDCTYIIIGKEVGENGTPHLQGYIRLPAKRRLAFLKALHHGAHWEIARGTPTQNRTYCSKEGAFEERGTVPRAPHEAGGAATKVKYQTAWDLAREGNIEEIDSELLIKHYGTLKRIAFDHLPPVPALPDTCGIWICGPSGAGKSTKAREEYPDYYLKACNKWWDGYEGEENVILEDFDPDHSCLGHHLKLWCDKWDFIAERKGSSLRIRPKRFIITSQYEIHECFTDQKTIDALRRRCTVVRMERAYV